MGGQPIFSNLQSSRGFGKGGSSSQTLPTTFQPKPKPPLAVMEEDLRRRRGQGQNSNRQSIEDRPGIEVRQRASLPSHGTMSPQETIQTYMQAIIGPSATDVSAWVRDDGAFIPDASTRSQKRKYDAHQSMDTRHAVADDSGIAMFAEEGGSSVLGLIARASDGYPWRTEVEESKARRAQAKVDLPTDSKKPKTSSTIQSKNPSAPASTQTSRKPSSDGPLRRKSSAPDVDKQSKPAHVQDQILNLPPGLLAAARRSATDEQRHHVGDPDARAPAVKKLSTGQEDLSKVAEVESAREVQSEDRRIDKVEDIGQAKVHAPEEVDELASDPGDFGEGTFARQPDPVVPAQVTVEEGSSDIEVHVPRQAGSSSKVLPAKASSKEEKAAGAISSKERGGEPASALRPDCVCGQCTIGASDDDYTIQSMEDWVQEGKTRMQSMTKLFNSILELSLERDGKIRHHIQGIEQYGTTMDIKRNEFGEQQREARKWMSTGFWVKPEPQD